FEVGVGDEVASGPFPDVADQLPAAVRAVAGRTGGDLNRSRGAPVGCGAAAVGGFVAPWVGRFGPGAGGRGEFPFRFGGQPPPGPPTERIGLPPADVADRQIGFEVGPGVEVAALPASR